MIKSLVKSILTKHYGVYGMLQPPCNGNFFQRIWYKLTNSLYTWSGIPKQWEEWIGDWEGPIITREFWERHVMDKTPRHGL